MTRNTQHRSTAAGAAARVSKQYPQGVPTTAVDSLMMYLSH